MDRNGEMRLLQGVKQKGSNGASATAVFEAQGLAGWVHGLMRGLRGQREVKRKQLRLVETLALGGKRQLMLVTCAGESFLVGGGLESVETIVRLKAEVSLDTAGTSLGETCR
jgi:hypothetical protein